MTRRENEHHHQAPEPENPSPLPPELAEFLRDQRLACLTHGTDRGTMLVIKAPQHEIRSVQGRVPIELRHELYQHPAAPVIRLVTRIYDQPDAPLALETFINVDDEQQRADYGELARQDELDLLFYDEQLRHSLTKRVRNAARPDLVEVLITALQLRARIPSDRFDFDLAKAEVMEATSL